MRWGRRSGVTAGLGATCAVLGAVGGAPILLVVAAALGGWLVAHQWGYVAETAGLDVEVSQSALRSNVAIDEPAIVRIGIRLSSTSPLAIDVTPTLPAAVDVDGDRSGPTLQSGDVETETVVRFRTPVAGSHVVGAPSLRFRDPGGFAVATVERGEPVEVTVRPRRPHEIHVGEGGSPLESGYGEHESGGQGEGIEPIEVRPYVAGDDLSRIDWKATARLRTPHVREFETMSSHRTALVVDHRARLGLGREGETALDYLREVALGVATDAEANDDPLGLFAVGDGGITVARDPDTSRNQYRFVEQRLSTLTPTSEEGSPGAEGGVGVARERDGRVQSREPRGRGLASPARARRLASRTAGEDGALESMLAPFFASTEGYVHRLADRPLFRTVRSRLTRLGGPLWTVIVTDDADHTEIHEAAKVARGDDGRVLVFLAPRVLYEPGGLDDLDGAYERYRDFEAFRRRLSGLERVTAFEVAPGDRLDAVLARHRTARGQIPGGDRSFGGVDSDVRGGRSTPADGGGPE